MTLNATAFYYVFDDLQVQVFDAIAVQFETSNAGEVTTKGVDLGWSWRTPVEGLNLSGNLSYLDAYFSAPYVTFLGEDLEGRDASTAPRWSGNLAFDWSVPMGDSLELALSGNAQYSDSYFTTTTSFNDFVQPSYWAFDASASVGDPDGAWKLSLIGVNLTDKLWVSSSGGRPFLPGANPFGVPVGDDIIVSQNRGRQVYAQASFKF